MGVVGRSSIPDSPGCHSLFCREQHPALGRAQGAVVAPSASSPLFSCRISGLGDAPRILGSIESRSQLGVFERSVQPVLEEFDKELEEAASVLGASRFQTFRRVIFPALLPALLTGFALAFARALGEYGSVVFISGNMPHKTEIVPLLIVTKLEQYDYTGATALASVMLIASFGLLLLVNLLQRYARRAEA